jgi:hypothetical protein
VCVRDLAVRLYIVRGATVMATWEIRTIRNVNSYPLDPDYDPETDAAIRQFLLDRLNASMFAIEYAAFGIRQPLSPEPMRDVTHSADRLLPGTE